MWKVNRIMDKRMVLKLAEGVYKVFRLVILLGISYVILQPIMRQISLSMALPEDLDQGSFTWIPHHPTFTNFINIRLVYNYFVHFWISVKGSVVSTAIQLLVSSLVGYGLARYPFRGNKLIFILVIITIIMPVQLNSIPLYLEYRFFDFFGIGSLIGLFTGKELTINLLNSLWVYYIPAMLGVGVNSGLFIFIFRQFFLNMPKELEEAAQVDGCNPFVTYARIIVPNTVPVFVTVSLLSMVFYWNESAVAGILISGKDNQSLVNALKYVVFMASNGFNPNVYKVITAAILLIVAAPLMLIYILGQRFFVESMDRSGIKG